MSRNLTKRFGLLAVLSLLGLPIGGLTSSPSAVAASLMVDGSCSLADAVEAANTDAAVGACPAGSGADKIRLAVDVSLTEPLPKVTSNITILGGGHVIERADTAPEFRLFAVEEASLSLNDVTSPTELPAAYPARADSAERSGRHLQGCRSPIRRSGTTRHATVPRSRCSMRH